MKKKVAIIGGNEFQAPLILKAKKCGYETHVFAWQVGDIGETIADVFHPISITEKDQILKVCEDIKPSAVCTIGSDLAAITANYVANNLGLPSNPVQTAVVATNKFEMRSAFSAAGVPVPAYARLLPGGNYAKVKEFHFPIIIKPTDRSGSRGIRKLSNWSELESAVYQATEYSFEHAAIAEEYIEGAEYSCETISYKGCHTVLAVTEKYTTGSPYYIETGHIEPSGLSKGQLHTVEVAVLAGLDALHITTGASHTEFKVLPSGEIRIIEIGARMGGDCIGSDLVSLSTGIDFVKMVLDTALGLPPDFTIHDAYGAAAVRFIFSQKDLQHLQQLQKTNPAAIFRKSEIQVTDSANIYDSGSRFGFYIVTCENRETAIQYANLR